MDFAGISAPLTTPFAADGKISLADLKHNVGLYNRTGLKGYVVLGSTGEAVLLSSEEMDDVLAAVKESAAPGKLLIAGTGAESTAETIARTRRAAELGYQAALVKTPHYFKPQYTADVLIAHFRRVADASPIPVLLYSVPQYTGIALEAPEVAALAEHPNIAGIKESSGNVQRTGQIIAAAPKRFQTLVGSASTLYASLRLGAVGGIQALADVLPERCVELYVAYRSGQHERAQQLQEALVPFSKEIVSEGGPTGVKCAMDFRGYRGGLPRPPLLPLSAEKKRRIESLLQGIESEVARA